MALPVFPTPPGLAWSVKRGVEWSTPKADAISGKNIRYANWTFPKRHFEAKINVLRTNPAFNEWQTFEGFFNSLQGAFGLFAYDDPNDDTIATQPFGAGDGATTAFQLVRTLGGWTEPVFIINGTPSIFVGGVLTVPASISPYGVVNFSGPPAPAAALTWTGRYYFPCQFDDDIMGFENFMFQLMRLGSIKFSTVKLP